MGKKAPAEQLTAHLALTAIFVRISHLIFRSVRAADFQLDKRLQKESLEMRVAVAAIFIYLFLAWDHLLASALIFQMFYVHNLDSAYCVCCFHNEMGVFLHQGYINALYNPFGNIVQEQQRCVVFHINEILHISETLARAIVVTHKGHCT